MKKKTVSVAYTPHHCEPLSDADAAFAYRACRPIHMPNINTRLATLRQQEADAAHDDAAAFAAQLGGTEEDSNES